MTERASEGTPPAVRTSDTSAAPTPLLVAFAERFPQAAAWLTTPDALRLLEEATVAGVRLGGYIDEGPDRGAARRAYSHGPALYLPRHADQLAALSDFLFELSNALHAAEIGALNQEARSRRITASRYVRALMRLELESALRAATVWLSLREQIPPTARAARDYDAYFFVPQHAAIAKGETTMEALVKSFLSRRFNAGSLAGKSHEQVYQELYEQLAPA